MPNGAVEILRFAQDDSAFLVGTEADDEERTAISRET